MDPNNQTRRITEFFEFIQDNEIDLTQANITFKLSDKVWDEYKEEMTDRGYYTVNIDFSYNRESSENLFQIKKVFGPLLAKGYAPYVRLEGSVEIPHHAVSFVQVGEEVLKDVTEVQPTKVNVKVGDAFECKYTCEAKRRRGHANLSVLTDGALSKTMTEDQIREAIEGSAS